MLQGNPPEDYTQWTKEEISFKEWLHDNPSKIMMYSTLACFGMAALFGFIYWISILLK